MPYIAFEVRTLDHTGRARCLSRHFTAKAALSHLARAERRDARCGGESDNVSVWCADDNRKWSPNGFRAAVRRGDYA